MYIKTLFALIGAVPLTIAIDVFDDNLRKINHLSHYFLGVKVNIYLVQA